jgi:hypothetical protein
MTEKPKELEFKLDKVNAKHATKKIAEHKETNSHWHHGKRSAFTKAERSGK